jgi:hypothetical protein
VKTFARFVCLIAFATIVDAKPALLVSQKQHLSIVVDAPMGWEGPVYSGGTRSYETWSFSMGTDSKGSHIEIRVDPVRDSKLEWNTANKEQIKKTFDDFSNPEVEMIAKIMIDQKQVVVWAAHNVDGELLIAKVRRDGCDLNFSLRTNRREELRRYQKSFLDFVKSVQFR